MSRAWTHSPHSGHASSEWPTAPHSWRSSSGGSSPSSSQSADADVVASTTAWRREWDSNPRWVAPQWFSRPPRSAAPASLRGRRLPAGGDATVPRRQGSSERRRPSSPDGRAWEVNRRLVPRPPRLASTGTNASASVTRTASATGPGRTNCPERISVAARRHWWSGSWWSPSGSCCGSSSCPWSCSRSIFCSSSRSSPAASRSRCCSGGRGRSRRLGRPAVRVTRVGVVGLRASGNAVETVARALKHGKALHEIEPASELR